MAAEESKPTEVQGRWARVWRRLLLRAVVVEVVVALCSVVVGFLVAGAPGLVGGAIGSGIAAVFLLLSLLIMYLGRNLDIGMLGGALGLAFIVKAFTLMITVWAIKGSEWINGPVSFFTIVAAVVLTSILEVTTVLKARVPYVDPEA